MSSASSGTPAQRHRSLVDSVNTATRSLHARLNKGIVSHLPQALPPRASDPSTYVTGLLHIAPVYSTFESLWLEILTRPPRCQEPAGCLKVDGPLHDRMVLPDDRADCTGTAIRKDEGAETGFEVLDDEVPRVCGRMHHILGSLYLPGLLRYSRLRGDIGAMTGWTKEVVDGQIADVSSKGPLGSFVEHIKKVVLAHPHVLISYSYILYMALFAGGRFMRASLESADEEFWSRIPSPVRPNMVSCTGFQSEEGPSTTGLKDDVDWKDSRETPPSASPCSPETSPKSMRKPGPAVPETSSHDPTVDNTDKDIACSTRQHSNPHISLQFFHFPTAEDGEDLKREFKGRLPTVESRLTEGEFRDVVEEGVRIFEHMVDVVAQLDHVCNPTPAASDSEGKANEKASILRPERLTQLARLRDSVVVARERNARKSRQQLRNSPAGSGSEEDWAGGKGMKNENGGVEKMIRFEDVPDVEGKGKAKWSGFDGAVKWEQEIPPSRKAWKLDKTLRNCVAAGFFVILVAILVATMHASGE
jgi:heme oxygenase